MTARELGVVAEPPVGLGGGAADEQLAVDREPRVGCHPCRHAQLLVRHRRDPTSPARRPPAVDSGCARVSELRRGRRPREHGSARPAGSRWRAGLAPQALRKVVTVVFCDLCDSTQLGERLDPETLRQVIGVVLRRDERRPRAPRGRDREVHRRRRHGRVRRTRRCARTTRCARCGPRPRCASALAELNEELERRWGVTLADAHRRQHGRGDRRRPRRAARASSAATPSTSPRASSRRRLPGRSSSASARSSSSATPSPWSRSSRWSSRARAGRCRAFRLLDVDVGAGGRRAGAHLAARRPRARAAASSRRPSSARSTATAASCSRSSAPPASASRGSRTTSPSPSASRADGRGRALRVLRRGADVLAAARGRRGARGQRRRRSAPTRCGPGSRALLEGDDDAAVIVERVAGAVGWSESAADADGDLLGGADGCWRRPRRRAPAGRRPRGRPLGRADPPRPHRARRGDARRACRSSSSCSRATRPPRRQARLRRRRAAARAASRSAATTAALLVEHLLGDDGVAARAAPTWSSRAPRATRCSSRSSCACSSTSASSSAATRASPPCARRRSRCRRPSTRCSPPASTGSSPASVPSLEAGAVIGSSFGRGALLELVDERRPPRSSTRSSQALVRKQLIAADGGRFAGDPTFSFSHALVRDVAYEGMLKARRADLHARYADWLERAAGERAGEYDEILGYHLERAHRYLSELGPVDERARELGARAAGRLGSSGGRALARGDIRSAVSLLERAVSLLDADDPARRELTIKLGIALAETGQLSRVDALLRDRLETSGAAARSSSSTTPSGGQHVVELEGRADDRAARRQRRRAHLGRRGLAPPRAHRRARGRAGRSSTTARATAPTCNGERIASRAALRDGDVLRFGDTVVLFRAPVAAAPTARRPLRPARTCQGGGSGIMGDVSASELKAAPDAERTGDPFLVFRDGDERQRLVALERGRRPGLDRAAAVRGRGARLGRPGVAAARAARARRGGLDRRRRRPVAQRHVRQRRAHPRPAPARRRRHAASSAPPR